MHNQGQSFEGSALWIRLGPQPQLKMSWGVKLQYDLVDSSKFLLYNFRVGRFRLGFGGGFNLFGSFFSRIDCFSFFLGNFLNHNNGAFVFLLLFFLFLFFFLLFFLLFLFFLLLLFLRWSIFISAALLFSFC